MTSIEILLVDDHRIVRESLANLLVKQTDFQVVGQAEDGRKALRLVAELKPRVVVMDVGMAGMNGIDATRQILEIAPEVRVIGLSMHSERRFVEEMLRAGAVGYLLKDCAFEQLVLAIRTVAEGRFYLGPRIVDEVLKHYVRQLSSNASAKPETLTTREREVVQLLAEGKTTLEIADILKVSAKTVETHRRNVMEKLKIFSVAELTKYALREGLTFLDH